MHLPGGAGNFLVHPKWVGYGKLARGYYYNTWLHVTPSVIDNPPTDYPRANSGLCFNRCPDVIPDVIAPATFPCDLSPAQCYPVLAADQVFAVSTLNDLEAGYTGASPSTRSCRRRLQNEAIEPPPLAASNFSYIDACTAAGIDPQTARESCDTGCPGTTMDENCAYDYCATGDSSFIDAYKDICAIDENEKLLLSRPPPAPPSPSPPPPSPRPPPH